MRVLVQFFAFVAYHSYQVCCLIKVIRRKLLIEGAFLVWMLSLRECSDVFLASFLVFDAMGGAGNMRG